MDVTLFFLLRATAASSFCRSLIKCRGRKSQLKIGALPGTFLNVCYCDNVHSPLPQDQLEFDTQEGGSRSENPWNIKWATCENSLKPSMGHKLSQWQWANSKLAKFLGQRLSLLHKPWCWANSEDRVQCACAFLFDLFRILIKDITDSKYVDHSALGCQNICFVCVWIQMATNGSHRSNSQLELIIFS